MNSRRIVRDFTIAFIVAISMATFSSRRLVKSHDDIGDSSGVLSQQTRNEIYQLIEHNEGMHFRKICREMDKKMGVVQYHISVLEKNGLIRAVKDGRYKCFFAIKNSSDAIDYQPVMELNHQDRLLRENVITSMKRVTPKKIITYLNKNGKASHQTLAEISGVSPQAITFHCQRLESIGLINSTKVGRQKFYSLADNVLNIMGYIDI